jgi:hypothetical protein
MNGGGQTSGSMGGGGAGLGILSIGLQAEVANFIFNMRKAIEVLQFFRNQAMSAGKMVGGQYTQMAQQAQAMAGTAKGAMGAAGQEAQKFTGLLDQYGNKIKTTGATTVQTIDKVSKTAMTRGKQGLGAVLDFSAGVKQFLLLNMRWFIIWRSFWAVWGQVQKAVTEFKDLMQETALALRTGVTDLESYVEKQLLGIRIQKEAIKATMQHAITMKDYIKSFYYLTTAGIAASDALNFVNDSIKTAIALDEDHVTTVRLLTGLYNVFGETITDVATRQDKFQKISAILAATFREQDIELKDYSDALPYVAAQWKQSGNSLEVLVAALGVMGTRFMRGSKSATSLTRSLSMLMRYPERFAELTGMAFDPKKPLDFLAVIGEMNKSLASGTMTFDKMGFSAEEMGKLFKALGLRGARAGAVLIDAFKDWEIQIQKNNNATFELVEQMARLAELTVPKQLEIMTNILRGWVIEMLKAATSTGSFARALERVNDALRAMAPLFKMVGSFLGVFVGSFGKMVTTTIALILAWKVKFAAVTTLAFASHLKAASGFGAALHASFLITFAKLFIIFQSFFGLAKFAYSVYTGDFEEQSKKHAAELMMTEKTTWDNIFGYMKAGFDGHKQAMRVQTAGMRKAWRKHLRQLEEDRKFNIEQGLMTEEDANAEFYRQKVQYLQGVLGEQFTHEHEMELAREQGFEVEQGQFDKKEEFYKNEWPKLFNELMKMRLDAFSYELWALKKQFEKIKSEYILNGKEILDLEKWYAEKRADLQRTHLDETRANWVKMQGNFRISRLSGFKKEIAEIQKHYADLANQHIGYFNRLVVNYAKRYKGEKELQEKVTAIQKDHENGNITATEAFYKYLELLGQSHFLALRKIVQEGANRLRNLRNNEDADILEKNEERLKKQREQEKEWDKEETKIFEERYGRHASEWEKEFAKFHEINEKRREEIRQREKDIEKTYEGTGKRRIKTEKRIDRVLKRLRAKEAKDYRTFLKENAAAYYLYTNQPFKAALAEMQDSLKSFAEYQKDMWLNIGDSIRGAMGDAFYEILRGADGFSDRLTQIWIRLRDTILGYIAEMAAQSIWESIMPEKKTPSGPGIGEWLKILFRGAKGAPDVGGGNGGSAPADLSPGVVGKVVPVHQDVTIVNIIDPNMVPAALLKNRELVVNIIGDDIMNKGSTRSVIQNIR